MIEFATDYLEKYNCKGIFFEDSVSEKYKEQICIDILDTDCRYYISEKLLCAIENTDVSDEIFNEILFKNFKKDYYYKFIFSTMSPIKTIKFLYSLGDSRLKDVETVPNGRIADSFVFLAPIGGDYKNINTKEKSIGSCGIVLHDKTTGYSYVHSYTFPSFTAMRLFKSLLIYIYCSDADIVLGKNSKEYSDAVKNIKRFPPGHKKRKMALDTIQALKNTKILGSRITYINRHEHEESGEHRSHSSPAPHWRRGHYRLQHFGKENSESKILYIAPTGVCMPDFENNRKTYKVV